MTDYLREAKDDAVSTVMEYRDAIIDGLLDDGKASDDLHNDYGNGDAYHHESHVDKYYDLTEAAAVLAELDDYEETDSGLWDGQEPRQAIATQAAFTYGNAVLSQWQDLIAEINDSADDVMRELDAANEDADADAQDAIEEKRADLREKLAEAEADGASEDELLALDEELEAIDDFDPSDLEDERAAAKRTALEKVIIECCENF